MAVAAGPLFQKRVNLIKYDGKMEETKFSTILELSYWTGANHLKLGKDYDRNHRVRTTKECFQSVFFSVQLYSSSQPIKYPRGTY